MRWVNNSNGVRRPWIAFCLMSSFALGGCEDRQPVLHVARPALPAPTFDEAFRKTWNDGSMEVGVYETVRLRGVLRKAAATSLLKRANFSEDDRVAVRAARSEGVFPAMQMNWLERYSAEGRDASEMTSIALALSSVDGRVPGIANKVTFSVQAWDGPLFHQLLFDGTGVRSHQYSYFENEGDEQITLAYPRDGVSGDALWLWARHMAAPSLAPGTQRSVAWLPSVRDARSQHRPLTWTKATLERSARAIPFKGRTVETFSVRAENETSETFLVEADAPFRVIHWENSKGERADFVSSSRLAPAPEANKK